MSKHPDTAKDEAVRTTQKLVLASFGVAFVIAFGVPIVLPLVVSSATQEPQTSIIRILVGFITSVFYMWFSSNRLSSVVGLAIDAAVDREIELYQRENPTVEELEKAIQQEYCCAIHPKVRSKEFISPSSAICDERTARDAIFIGLAHNDLVLEQAALAAVQLTLQSRAYYRKSSAKAQNIFFSDIYTYLKAWLMMSVSHGRPMPVKFIRQRFPNESSPDKEAYVLALGYAKEMFKTPEVIDCINQEYLQKSEEILERYFDILIEKIKAPSPVDS